MYRCIGEFETHDDDLVARFRKMCCSAVQRYSPRTAFAGYDVGLETVAVVDIGHQDLFPGQDPGSFHQVFVYGDTSLVVEVGIGDCGPVDLAAEHPTHVRLMQSLVYYCIGRCTDRPRYVRNRERPTGPDIEKMSALDGI